MRLRGLSLRGVTRFTAAEPVTINLDELGPGLVALVGPNGAGKTTVLESAIAALYRSFPSRPGWYEHLHGRDSFLEVLFEEAGQNIRVRTQVDAERRTTEQYVFVDGTSVTTGRAAEAASEIERRFGSLDLLLASVVSAQNRAGNFLLMSKSQRKDLFAELLGLGRLQVLHESARERRAAAQVELEAAWRKVAELEAQLAGKPAIEASAVLTRTAQEEAAGRLVTAREEEAAATAALERARTAGERLAALRSAKDSAARALADADQALKDAIAAGPKARQDAAARRRTNDSHLEDIDSRVTRAAERRAEGLKAIEQRRARLENTLAEREALEAAAAQVKVLDDELAALQEADRLLAAAESARDLAQADVAFVEKRIADEAKRLDEERLRLQRQSRLLDQVPCMANQATEDGLHLWIDDPDVAGGIKDLAGNCPLLKDAQEARARATQLSLDPAFAQALGDSQGRLGEAVVAVTAAALACDPIRATEIRKELPFLREKAARASTLARAAADLDGLAAEVSRVNEELAKEMQAAAECRERLAADAATIENDLRKALGEAMERESTARGRCETAREASLKAERAYLEASGEGKTVGQAEAELSGARETRYARERELREADRAHAAAEAALEVLAKHEAALPAAKATVHDAEQAVGAWALLEQALGKDGIQALEIDAAGPEVARLCNELLEACYGPRFSISFETLREKKSKAGEFAEAFEVRVRDRGQERPVEALSGGERVIVGEAIGLAISILNARKNSIRWETLIRDETSGALDPENAQAYVDMLRRALALGGFRNVLFVAHQKEVVERADVRLVVADGRVSIDGAPLRGAMAEATA